MADALWLSIGHLLCLLLANNCGAPYAILPVADKESKGTIFSHT
jgi:hypothetical protein